MIDYLSILDTPPSTPEQRATTQRLWAKWSAWAKEHPDCVPRIPHYRHVCLDPHCTRDHDVHPSQH